jgi:flavin reductase (DIM6/NTAB) family NADH-FMN oxidoreductase RutF
MGRQHWKGSVLMAPVPPALVTCGSSEKPNILTVAWTGIVCTHPPVTYISVRPSRYSYPILLERGEFVINLPTSAMAKTVDLCGMKTGAKVNKARVCGLTLIPSETVAAPSIEECPVSLECRVTETKALGSHTMFLAEVTAVSVDERFMDSKGKLNLQQAGLLAYAHGEYFALGRKCGDFGFSVRRRKKHST